MKIECECGQILGERDCGGLLVRYENHESFLVDLPVTIKCCCGIRKKVDKLVYTEDNV